MVSPVAKRRVSIDPRQTALDFGALAATESIPAPVVVPGPAPVLAPTTFTSPVRVAPASAPSDPALAVTAEARIALRLSERLGRCEVVWRNNRRTVLSSMRQPDRIVVRMHRVFADAPDDLIDAVGHYLSRGDRRASRTISRWIDAHRHSISAAARPRTLDARGETYDLAVLFDELEQEHFPGLVGGVGITWGRRGPVTRRRRRTIRLGTYSHDERVIRVHPHLDQAWVPRFFVRFIVFHEMLHHVEPARVTEHRTEFHTPAFRARERAYPEYERAIAWERANLSRLLRG